MSNSSLASRSSKSIPKVKIILLGDTGVGKTSLVAALKGEEPSIEHQPTVGIDFFSKILSIKDSQQFKVHFWDTAGQQRFRCIIPSYVRNSHIAIIMYDVTRRKSFENILSWLELFRDYSSQNSQILIVGNKIDLLDRLVDFSQANVKTTMLGLSHIEISAKQLKGIDNLEEKIKEMLSNLNLKSLTNQIPMSSVNITQKNSNEGVVAKVQHNQTVAKFILKATGTVMNAKCCQF